MSRGPLSEPIQRIAAVFGNVVTYFTRAQEVREAESRRTLVSAQVTGAFATEDGRPARAPDSFREKLSALLVPDGTVPQSQ